MIRAEEWRQLISGMITAASVALLITLAGCAGRAVTAVPVETGATPPPSVAPTRDVFGTLRDRHNARIHALPQIWVRGRIDATWYEAEEPRREIGDVLLVMVLPHRVSASVSKVGHTIYWAGADEEIFWIFDNSGPERVAHICRNENRALARNFNVVHPLDVAHLCGLVLIPSDATAIRARGSRDWIASFRLGTREMRVRLNGDSSLVSGVELFHEDRIEAFSELGEYVNVRLAEGGHGPQLPAHIKLITPNESVVSFTLEDLRDRPPRQPTISPSMFDYSAVRHSMNPDRVYILDGETARPAIE